MCDAYSEFKKKTVSVNKKIDTLQEQGKIKVKCKLLLLLVFFSQGKEINDIQGLLLRVEDTHDVKQ